MAHPLYEKSVLILLMNDGDGTTTFKDWSPLRRNATRGGDAKLSANRSKWYTTSGSFDSSGDYLSIPALDLANGVDFCFECWAYTPYQTATADYLFSQFNNGGVSLARYPSGLTGVLRLRMDWGFSDSAVTVPIAQWYHVALTRQGTTLKVWLDGVQVLSGTSPTIAGNTCYIGRSGPPYDSNNDCFFGSLQDVRIVLGDCVYTAPFIPPGPMTLIVPDITPPNEIRMAVQRIFGAVRFFVGDRARPPILDVGCGTRHHRRAMASRDLPLGSVPFATRTAALSERTAEHQARAAKIRTRSASVEIILQSTRTRADQAAPEDQAIRHRVQRFTQRDQSVAPGHENQAPMLTGDDRARYLSRPHTDRGLRTRGWCDLIWSRGMESPPDPPYVPPDHLAILFEMPDGYLVPWTSKTILFDYRPRVPAPVPSQITSAARSRWRVAVPVDRGTRARWSWKIGWPTNVPGNYPPIEPPAHERFVIPTRAIYMRLHDLHVVRLPDRTPLPWRSLTLRTDASQWAWSMSLELMGKNAGALIDPGSDPVTEIEISLNGATWICLAEDWTESSQFGQWTSTAVTGRSRAALLSPRFAPPRSYTETQDRTAAQLAEQELPYGSAWSVIWEAADWLVPAGAWSYQDLSPIQAIARLAQAAGALVYADPSAYSMRVRPVYRILPWDYAPGMEDILIPEAALVGSVSRRYRYPDQADAVYLYGGEIGGIQALVYRNGSAASTLAPDQSEPLLTHVDAARALGGRILAGKARPPGLESFTMPVDPRAYFPLVRLGDWARVELLEGVQAGPVTSIQISVSSDGDGTRVRQTLGLGETANDYQRLLNLLPREPRRLVQVVTAHAGNTATVRTLNGGLLRVRGTGTVDGWYWVRVGRIEDPAPALEAGSVGV